MAPSLHVRVALGVKAPDGVSGFELDVEFEVPPGVTVLFGPSGAGKSRTLGCIAGIVRPSRGRIALGDEAWFDGKVTCPIHRRRAAYVFQSLALFPHMAAEYNVEYGIARDVPSHERRARAIKMLERMHVPHLVGRKPRTFSGGEAQRVALARAFAMHPRVLLLDEPFSALDSKTKTALLAEARERIAEAKIPTILVTHDHGEARALGERVLFMELGRIIRTADVSDPALSSPKLVAAERAGEDRS